MKRNVKIKLGDKVIYEVDVEADNDASAMVKAYDALELETFAVVDDKEELWVLK